MFSQDVTNLIVQFLEQQSMEFATLRMINLQFCRAVTRYLAKTKFVRIEHIFNDANIELMRM